ncbi:hypothetical protein LUZ61_000437 [Rhynchospora tenuis]|uniref:Uncharacterized protein n=1 Tax=Rhynchospora tenuis TaxID=198213 RepID=A0AAD6EPU9_9POAL|nr:hypothetical protein LUZ61_000437 [Rhynchospora tenuis]
MACTTQSLISLNSCAFPSKRVPKWPQKMKGYKNFVVYASSTAEDDCNEEECAPEKEVGNLSMQWKAEENTKVIGTFPPKKKGWTGYVEKDTAGQTNIYSVEPTIYVAESAISSGAAGTSSEGAENTAALAAGLALISIAAASSILIQVNKNQTVVESVPYAGPPLSYYISKFKPAQFVEASIPAETQDAPSIEASVPPEASSSSSTVEASMAPTGELQS